MRIQVDGELGDEDACQARVEAVEGVRRRRWGALRVDERRAELCLHHIYEEVLRDHGRGGQGSTLCGRIPSC